MEDFAVCWSCSSFWIWNMLHHLAKLHISKLVHTCSISSAVVTLSVSESGFDSWDLLQLAILLTNMGMGQYLLIPFLVGWTSIYQLFWCSPGVQGFDPQPLDKYSYTSLYQVFKWLILWGRISAGFWPKVSRIFFAKKSGYSNPLAVGSKENQLHNMWQRPCIWYPLVMSK